MIRNKKPIRKPARRFYPTFQRLECRRLLASWTASWVGQTAGIDYTSPTVGVGPDGIADIEVDITAIPGMISNGDSNSSPMYSINGFVQIQATVNSITYTWETSPNLNGDWLAEFISTQPLSSGNTNGQLFFSPSVNIPSGTNFTISYYSTSSTLISSVNVISSNNVSSTDSIQYPTPSSVNFQQATWGGQNAIGTTNPGWININLSSPIATTIQVRHPTFSSTKNKAYNDYIPIKCSGGTIPMTRNETGNGSHSWKMIDFGTFGA